MGARRQPGGSLAGRPLLEPSCSHAASGKGLFSILVLRDKREAVTCYLLLVTCYWLLVTCYVLLVACYVLLVTRYLQAIVRPPIIFSRFSAHDFRNPSSTIARSTCTMVALLATDVLCCWSQNANLLLTSLFVLLPLPK